MARFGFRVLLVLTICFASVVAGCQALSSGNSIEGRMTFSGPNQESIPPGGFLPGTGVQYVGLADEKGVEMRIDGKTAFKKTADSVNWRGRPLDGVDLNAHQRVLWFNENSLSLGGTVVITIDDAVPRPLSSPPDAPAHYKLPATYNVNIGDVVPGTTLALTNIDSEKGAEFSGWAQDQYGFRQTADSVEWDGSLRPGVAISQRLRVGWIGDHSVRLVGFVHVFLTP